MARLTTYYDTLQVSRSATQTVIRAAYRTLCQQYHPDKNLNDLDRAHQRMKRLNEAYAVLSDPARRSAYDQAVEDNENAGPQNLRPEESKANNGGSARTGREGTTQRNRHQGETFHRPEYREDENSSYSRYREQRYAQGGHDSPCPPPETPQQASSPQFEATAKKSHGGALAIGASVLLAVLFLSGFGTILLIAVVPAAIVALTGAFTHSRAWTSIAAIAAATVGVLTGNPAYVALDLAAVSIGYWIASYAFKKREPKVDVPSSPNSSPKTGGNWSFALSVLIGIGVATYFYVSGSSTGKSPARPVEVVAAPPMAPPMAPPVTPTVAPTPQAGTTSSGAANTVPQPKQDPGTAVAKRSTRQSQKPDDPNLYAIALKQVERQHPELNPDAREFRQDLVNDAFRRMNAYVRNGHAQHAALVRAVMDMERDSRFDRVPPPSAATLETPTGAAGPQVLDPGGHRGFDPACRWVTPSVWSCQKP